MTFNIIVIKPNEISNLNTRSEAFDNEIKKITEIVKVDDNSFGECIVEKLGMYRENEEVDLQGDTEVCDETYDKKIYQFCYVDPFDNNTNDETETETKLKLQNNKLASNLLYVQKKITGNIVLFCCKIGKDGTAKNISMTIDDLKDILNRKFFHKAIYCHSSGNMLEFTYHNDMNIFNEDNQDVSIRPQLQNIWDLMKTGIYYEFSIFKYNLILVTQTEKYGNESNKIISLLINDAVAKGSFVILHKITEQDYYNITIPELKKMVYLHKMQQLDENESDDKKINNLLVVKNKYVTLHNKYSKFKSDPENLNLNFEEFCDKEYLELNTNDIFNEIVKNEITKNEITKNEITKNEITKNEITKNELENELEN
jgi:hypothetical protein